MSFTADELQSFNDILDRKLSAHRREMERLFDQRLNKFRREVDQRLIAAQQEVIRVLAQKLDEQQSGMTTILQQQLTDAQMKIAQTVSQEVRQRQTQQQPEIEHTEHIAGIIDRSLAAQLLAIEELLNQRMVYQTSDEVSLSMVGGEHGPQFEAIELQTELPWEDLMEVFGKALDDRFVALGDRAQTATQHLEHQLSSRISALQHQLFDELAHLQVHSYGGNLTNVQEVFQSIEQLEHVIESMQVAMTANHALLSNRLFHHQQLPLERAHPAHPTQTTHPGGNTASVQSPNGMSGTLPRPAKERQ
ncbi:MAG TPA: hypothetical protein VKU38_18780 [Ktedonobacteraceae bacterium]|nr:hypothetical protein [Ktedonobacteraceae bacterium]